MQVHGAPVVGRTLGQKAPERHDRQAHQRPGPLRPPGGSLPLPGSVRPGGRLFGPRRERLRAYPADQQRGRADDEEVGPCGDAHGRGDAGEPGSDQAADAVPGVKTGHDAAPEAVLDRGGLGIHADIDDAETSAPASQHDEQLPGRGGERGHRQQPAEGKEPGLDEPAGRPGGQDGAGGRHGQHRTGRRPEQRQPEDPWREVQAVLDRRDTRRPGAYGQPHRAEDSGHCQPLHAAPVSHAARQAGDLNRAGLPGTGGRNEPPGGRRAANPPEPHPTQSVVSRPPAHPAGS